MKVRLVMWKQLGYFINGLHVRNMKKVLTLSFILLLLLINSKFASAENNSNQPYNENNFIPFKTTDGKLLLTHRASFGENKIVYLAGDTKSQSVAIWVMDVDGSNRTIVYANDTIDETFTTLKFSSDGKKILFVSFYWNEDPDKIETSIDILKKNGTVWDINCTKEEIYRLNRNLGLIKETSFNNEDSKIVYSKGTASNKDIWLMDSDGTNHKRLTNEKGMDWLPTFSPDGSKIAWCHSDGGPDPNRIWIMNSDGSDKKCITPDFNYCDSPTFTPNGKILFECAKVSPHSNKVDGGNIWMIDADGSNPILIVPREFGGNVRSTYPSINPDNTMIIFDHGLSTGGLYYVKEPDGDGIWEDSDGDGVADVCDGAPNDPDEGYIKGNVSDGFIPDVNIIYSLILIASVAIISKRKSK